MANNNVYSGEFDASWKDTHPQITISFVGILNDNSEIGYKYGRVGYVNVVTPDSDTYQTILGGYTNPNYMIGVRVRKNANPDDYGFEYLTDLYSNTGGLFGTLEGEYYDNQEDLYQRIFNYRTTTQPAYIIPASYNCNMYQYFYRDGLTYPSGFIGDFHVEINANCPIIELDVNGYVKAKDGTLLPFDYNLDFDKIDDSVILNKKNAGKDEYRYYIYNIYDSADSEINKNLKIVTKGLAPFCLYVNKSILTNEDTTLKSTGSGIYVSSQYSDDGSTWIDISGQIPSKYTHYMYYSKTGIFVQKFETNIPIFTNLIDAEKYLNYIATGDITGASDIIGDKALNSDSALTLKSDDDNAQAGLDIDKTELNEGYSRNVFNKMYCLAIPAIEEISSNLFNTDTSITDAIKEGLKLYGANPMDAIIDLSYYPFDVTKTVPYTSQNNIMFGSYMMTLDNSIGYIGRPRCIIDMGEIQYTPVFNDFRDMEPYSQLYIYLPYIAVHKLDISNYYQKTISLKYIVDYTSGSCIAVLSADGVIVDTFPGQIGVRQSISSIDYNAYSQNVTRNIVNTVRDAGGLISSAGYNASGGVNAKNIKATASGLLDFTQNLFESQQLINSQRISIRANGAPSANMCLPQYAYTYCVYNKQIRPKNELEIVGYPSNSGGKVKDFKGYLKCDKVSLSTTATVAEQREIYELLQNGVYIN